MINMFIEAPKSYFELIVLVISELRTSFVIDKALRITYESVILNCVI